MCWPRKIIGAKKYMLELLNSVFKNIKVIYQKRNMIFYILDIKR